MSSYFEYLRELVVRFFSDLGRFFSKAFASPWSDVPGNFRSYNSLLSTYSKNFGVFGWVLWVFFLLLLLAFIGGAIYGLVLLIRKYFRFNKKELDKDELREQVERLNYELYQAVQEKDKILNLKVGYMGLKPDQMNQETRETIEEVSSRFPKLVRVDNQYRSVDMSIPYKDGL